MRARNSSFLVALTASVLLGSACSTLTGDPVDDEQSAETTAPPTEEAPAEGGDTTEEAEQPAAEEPATGNAETDDGAPSLFDIDTVLAADPDCPAPVTGEPLVIGYAADLGELGSFADGPASQMASHMARLVNCSGGLEGRPLEVRVEGIDGDPVRTRDGTRGLVQGGASVLFGPPFPDPGFRLLEATGGAVPVMFIGSTEPALGDESSLSYLVSFSDSQGATAAAQFAQTQGWRQAVTLSAPGPYFGYNPRVFASVFSASGGTVIGDYFTIPFEQEDFADMIEEISADPPDVVYSGMLANQLVALRAQLDEAGLTEVEILNSDAFEATGGYSLAGNEGIYHVTHTDPGPDTRVQSLLASFADANGGVPPASPSMAALGGDAVAVVSEAYLRTRTTDPVELGRAISTVSVQGVTGRLTYSRSGSPNKPMYVHEVVDGQPSLAAVIGR